MNYMINIVHKTAKLFIAGPAELDQESNHGRTLDEKSYRVRDQLSAAQ